MGETRDVTDPHRPDIDAILAKRHDNGGDFWATPDRRIYVGSPFSTLSSLVMLHELGVKPSHEAVRGGLDLVWNAWRDDGRIRLAPKAPLYPCDAGQMVVERPHRALKELKFCEKKKPSTLATDRYKEIVDNLA